MFVTVINYIIVVRRCAFIEHCRDRFQTCLYSAAITNDVGMNSTRH